MALNETLPLSIQEDRLWNSYLRATRSLDATLDQELQRCTSLSLSEFELLFQLQRAKGGALRMSALADAVMQSRSRVTHTANRLARRGWVVRRSATEDRRGVELILTPTGRAEVEAAEQVHAAAVRSHFMSQLDPVLASSVDMAMTRVAQHLSVA